MIRRYLVAAAVCVLAGCRLVVGDVDVDEQYVGGGNDHDDHRDDRAGTDGRRHHRHQPARADRTGVVGGSTSSGATTSTAGAPVTAVTAPSTATSTVVPSALVMRANGLGVAASAPTRIR